MNFFVITPFKLDNLYEAKKNIVLNIAKAKGLRAYYASDYIRGGKFNLEKSIQLFREVDFFIADLSFERPSCYFEVGYAQSLNKKVFLIARKNTVIHQLLDQDKIETYTDLASYNSLLHSLIERAMDCSDYELLKIEF